MRLFRNKLLLLILISIAIRLIYGFSYKLQTAPDTTSYFRTAEQFISGDYSDYQGKRTPVYPLLIAATGFNRAVLAWFQASMGVGIAALLYIIFLRLTSSATLAFILGLSYALNPSQILFEFYLMSETTCTFLLILTVYFLFNLFSRKRSQKWYYYVLVGIVCSFCVLTRPQFLPLPVIIAFFLAFHLKFKSGDKIWKTGYFIAPVAVFLLAWMGFQYKKIGHFTMSPETGYSLTSHTIKFIESAPESYDDIKQLLIRHRTIKLKATNDTFNAVGASVPELVEMTGLSWIEICTMLKKMNLATIRNEPLLYLKSVFKSFVVFFKPTWYGRLFGIRPAVESGGRLLKTIAFTYALFHLSCMLIFLVFPLFKLVAPRLAGFFKWTTGISFIYVLVLISGISQAFVESGENARYKTSVEPLIICLALWIVLEFFFRRRAAGSDRQTILNASESA